MSDVDSPFRSPKSDSFAELDDQRLAIYQVGLYRQWVGWAFIGCLVTQVLNLALNALWNDMYNSPYVTGWAWNAYLLVGLVTAISQIAFLLLSVVGTFRLTESLSNRYLAILVSLLMIVPGISVLTLLTLNHLGNRYLQKHGIVVGVYGASARSVFDQLQACPLDAE